MVEHLTGMCKIWDSIPSTRRRKKSNYLLLMVFNKMLFLQVKCVYVSLCLNMLFIKIKHKNKFSPSFISMLL